MREAWRRSGRRSVFSRRVARRGRRRWALLLRRGAMMRCALVSRCTRSRAVLAATAAPF